MDIKKMDLASLRALDPSDVQGILTSTTLRRIFEACDALWLHSGDPKAPHAELTSGRCSDGFVDVLRVLKHVNLCRIMAHQLLSRLRDHVSAYQLLSRLRDDDGRVDWVIGSDHAGATLSFAVASLIPDAQHDFTEKGPDKTQVWKRFAIEPGEVVLQVEELVTTTGTLQAVRDGIRAGNPTPVTFAPFVLALVHRSDVYEFEGSPIVHLAHYDIKTWAPEECPLCAAGSERLRPKQNWAKLTGKG